MLKVVINEWRFLLAVSKASMCEYNQPEVNAFKINCFRRGDVLFKGRLFSQFKGVKLVNGEYPKKKNKTKEGIADPRRALKGFA